MIQPLPSSPVSSPAILLPVAYTLVILDHLHKSKVNLLATSTDFADSFLSLKGVSLPLAYLSFKNQIIYYLLSKTTPPPQTMIYVLHLCLYSKRGTKLSCQPIPLCCHLIQCNKRLLSVYYVLHIPDEKKTKEIESTSSRNSQSTKRHPGQHILQITDDTTHTENMENSLLSSFISWVFREGFPKEALSDLSFEIKIGV